MRYVLLSLLFVAWLPAQDVQEELRVVLRDLRVHVVDANGVPIEGLSQEDFIVRERGSNHNLRYFEEVVVDDRRLSSSGNVAPMNTDEREFDPQNARTVVLVLDSGNMPQSGFKSALNAMKDVIDQLGPGDLAKLIQIDTDMQDLTPFTRDREELLAGLEKANYKGAQWRDLVDAEREIINAILDFERAPSEADVIDAEEVREPLAKMVNRKVEVKEAIKANYFRTYYYNMMYIGRMLTYMSGSKSIIQITGGNFIESNGAFDDTEQMANQLGRTLNAANATMYTFLFKSNVPKAEAALNVSEVGSSINVRDLQRTDNFFNAVYSTGLNEFAISNDATRVASNTVFENNLHVESGPMHTVRATGGVLEKATNARYVGERVGKILDASSHYYRLGYAIDESYDIATVTVKLKERIRGARVLYGRELEAPTNYLDMNDRERDISMRTMLYFNDHMQDDLNCDWNFHLFQREEGGYTVPVMGMVPLKGKPKEGFEVAIAAFNYRDEVLDMVVSKVEKFPADSAFAFYDVLLPEDPPAYIKSYVRNLDNAEFSLHRIEMPKMVDDYRPTRITDLVFGGTGKDNPVPLNHTRKVVYKEKDKGLMGIDNRVLKDPFLINNKLFKTRFNDEFKKFNRMSMLFHIENLEEGLEDKLSFEFMYRSEDEWLPVRGRISEVQRIKASVRYVAELEVGKLPPGEYRVWVRVKRKDMEGELLKSRMFAIR